jgi:ArsR family transcriptional regulator, arsenate/arsenite/antimonite-responsive transcriptional repressor / arsenate reductase (thioredoxin)
MITDGTLSAAERAARHRALGDEHRVRIIDALSLSDRSPSELGQLIGVSTNLLAFHLDVLEEAGLIRRSASHGDARRRYVRLAPDLAPPWGDPPPLERPVEHVLFVCTANSARSQLASHLWKRRTGTPALFAGASPADEVHPQARAAARRHGLDLDRARPIDLEAIEASVDLVVSVCDRAHESALDVDAPALHWSIPDPVDRGEAAFDDVVVRLQARVERLARARELV